MGLYFSYLELVGRRLSQDIGDVRTLRTRVCSAIAKELSVSTSPCGWGQAFTNCAAIARAQVSARLIDCSPGTPP